MGSWVETTKGRYIVCDSSLDWEIDKLSPVARRLLKQGVNLTHEQAQALSPQPEEKLRDNSFDGEMKSPARA